MKTKLPFQCLIVQHSIVGIHYLYSEWKTGFICHKRNGWTLWIATFLKSDFIIRPTVLLTDWLWKHSLLSNSTQLFIPDLHSAYSLQWPFLIDLAINPLVNILYRCTLLQFLSHLSLCDWKKTPNYHQWLGIAVMCYSNLWAADYIVRPRHAWS